MKKSLHDVAAKFQEEHWWLTSRRKILETVIKENIKNIGINFNILDIGSGTGANFKTLSKFAQNQNIIGLESEAYAIELSKKQNDFNVIKGNLPDNIPFPDESFDLITILDVLEHIDDDRNSLKNSFAKVKSGGHILITVPAYQFLWSNHDEINNHKRRYTLKELISKMEECNIKIKYKSYFNSWLFPLITVIRFIKNHVKSLKDTDDTNIPQKPLNHILRGIMSSERFVIQKGYFPFGVSIIVLGYKEK